MNLTLIDRFVLSGMVFLAGFVDSIAGGGGLISLPAYLFVGLPSHYALATNKLSSAVGTLFSMIRYARKGAVIFRIGIPSTLGALMGSVLGARLVLLIPDFVLKTILTVLISLAAFFVLVGRKEQDDYLFVKNQMQVYLLALLAGFAIGLYDGFFGPGTGTFLIILYVSALKLNHVQASGTAKIVNLASNVGALFTFILNGKVVYSLGIPAAVFGILGNWLGSGLALQKGAIIIKPLMIVVLTLLMLKIVFR
uniref:Probable membrane transporter protein n=1 Tax=Fervidobacterium thailandense TaxID=1008305 RepID=A0A7C5VNM1_9BACT